MRRKHIILAALPILALLLMSCGEDRWLAYHDQTYQNLWVDSILRANYLWAEDIPSENSLTSSYFFEPDAFLKKVMSKSDSYSRIDSVKNLTKASQGLGYWLSQATDSISGEVRYLALINLVEPGSPAQEAGLRRGEWILEANGEPLDKEASALEEGTEMELLTGELSKDGGSLIVTGLKSVSEATVFPKAQILALESGLGKQGDIVYLCPRALTADAIKELENMDTSGLAKARRLVLDLRYSQDGDLEGLQGMASMILARSHGGEVLSIVDRHGQKGAVQEEVPVLLPEQLGSSPALDIQNLVVVTSSDTQGEAEMLINCLRPYISLTHIGENTKGVVYSRSSFLSPDGCLLLRPVTARVYNSYHEASYQGTGLIPDREIQETDYPQMVLPLGNAQEILLSMAIAMLDE